MLPAVAVFSQPQKEEQTAAFVKKKKKIKLHKKLNVREFQHAGEVLVLRSRCSCVCIMHIALAQRLQWIFWQKKM